MVDKWAENVLIIKWKGSPAPSRNLIWRCQQSPKTYRSQQHLLNATHIPVKSILYKICHKSKLFIRHARSKLLLFQAQIIFLYKFEELETLNEIFAPQLKNKYVSLFKSVSESVETWSQAVHSGGFFLASTSFLKASIFLAMFGTCEDNMTPVSRQHDRFVSTNMAASLVCMRIITLNFNKIGPSYSP